MSDQYQTGPRPATVPVKKEGKGCFFYGCLTTIVLTILLAVGLYFGAKRMIHRVVDNYTEPQGVILPQVTISDADYQALKTRATGFAQAVKENKKVEPLVLSAGDINALIAREPEFAPLAGHLLVNIVDSKVSGQVSMPLEQFGFKDRYFNGSATFVVSLEFGIPRVSVDQITVAGQSPPEEIMTQLRKENLMNEFLKKTENQEMLKRFESVEVKDGHIIIKSRG